MIVWGSHHMLQALPCTAILAIPIHHTLQDPGQQDQLPRADIEKLCCTAAYLTALSSRLYQQMSVVQDAPTCLLLRKLQPSFQVARMAASFSADSVAALISRPNFQNLQHATWHLSSMAPLLSIQSLRRLFCRAGQLVCRADSCLTRQPMYQALQACLLA